MRKAFILIMVAISFVACKKEESRPVPQGAPGRSSVNVEREIDLLKSILKEDPNNLQAWIKLGNITYDFNRCSEAVEAYGKALEIDPKNVDVRVDMGTCYRRLGRSDQALEEYQKALEMNPNHLYAHLNMAVVYAYDFGKKEEAIREYEKYLELAPTAPNVEQIRNEIAKLKTAP